MSRCSGKFVLRVSEAVHESLRELSFLRGESINSLCSSFIENGLGARVTKQKPTKFESLVAEIRKVWGANLLGVLVFGLFFCQEVRLEIVLI